MDVTELNVRRDVALAAKVEGNIHFGEAKWPEAIAAYSRPLDAMMDEFVRSPAMMARVGSSLVSEIYDILGMALAYWHESLQ